MLITRRDIEAAKAQKTHHEKDYIRNFTEEQLRFAKDLLDKGYAFKQIEDIFGLPPGQTVAWTLKRWSEGKLVKPDPTLCQYDIDITRVGPPKGGTRRKRTW